MVEPPRSTRLRMGGLYAGPLLALLVFALTASTDLGDPARAVLAMVAWMACWWLTEAIPLGATSLLPLVMLPLTGAIGLGETAAAYADPNVFLFLGGFLLAIAFEASGLHRRVALAILGRLGLRPRRLLLGFMVPTALISMWVSNTATALLMFPIVMAVSARTASQEAPSRGASLPTVLILGVTYAASIGGMTTLIGTPPNLLFAGAAARAGEPVGFLQWMIVGVPVAIVLFAATWAYLGMRYLRQPLGDASLQDLLRSEREALGPWRTQERLVLTVFLTTVAAWVFRVDLDVGAFTIPGWSSRLGIEVHDGTIAIAAALLLVAIPYKARPLAAPLDASAFQKVPWDVLLLFGGGFAIGAGFRATGLDTWLGKLLVGGLSLPLPLVMLLVSLLVIAASEIASNTALAALILPVLASAAPQAGLHPYWLMVPATLAASAGFMLPVATPPNALAYASGRVSVRQMARAGLVIDLAAALVVSVLCLALIPLMLRF